MFYLGEENTVSQEILQYVYGMHIMRKGSLPTPAASQAIGYATLSESGSFQPDT